MPRIFKLFIRNPLTNFLYKVTLLPQFSHSTVELTAPVFINFQYSHRIMFLRGRETCSTIKRVIVVQVFTESLPVAFCDCPFWLSAHLLWFHLMTSDDFYLNNL